MSEGLGFLIALMICGTLVFAIHSCGSMAVGIRQAEAQREAACLDRGGAISWLSGRCEVSK